MATRTIPKAVSETYARRRRERKARERYSFIANRYRSAAEKARSAAGDLEEVLGSLDQQRERVAVRRIGIDLAQLKDLAERLENHARGAARRAGWDEADVAGIGR